MIYEIKEKNCVVPLFAGWEETMIWSALQGYMGHVYVTDCDVVKAAQIVIADFCFFAGEPDRELVMHKPAVHTSDFIIMVPQNEKWAELIEDVYKERSKRVNRYAIRKEQDIFEKEKLTAIVSQLSKPFEVQVIEEDLFQQAKESDWAGDLVSQFATYEAYRRRGLGVAVTENGTLVAGASSYTIYQDGIEIEIDTKAEYRRRGLALTCGAGLILECLKRGWYPSWDAQNMGSVKLAEKLGYHFEKEYTAYEIQGY